MVQCAGRDDEDIIRSEGVGRFVYDNGVAVMDGHNDFHGGMPVQGVVFRLHVVIEFYAGKKIIVHRFADAVQNLDHIVSQAFLYLIIYC